MFALRQINTNFAQCEQGLSATKEIYEKGGVTNERVKIYIWDGFQRDNLNTILNGHRTDCNNSITAPYDCKQSDNYKHKIYR